MVLLGMSGRIMMICVCSFVVEEGVRERNDEIFVHLYHACVHIKHLKGGTEAHTHLTVVVVVVVVI